MINWKDISILNIIGKAYNRFWNYRGRYRVVKGGRASKKSATTSLWLIYHMMKMPLANTLVIRQVFKDHKDSTYAQLKWAVHRLGVAKDWQFKLSPLEIIYKPTGQKILFRGLDDPDSLASITVENGFLCWAWFEEAYQVKDERVFDKVDGSIRGEMPAGYFKQITLTFNPWSDKTWLKARFFDRTGDSSILAITTTFRDNEFIGEDDREYYSNLSPRRRRIEADGDWGISEGLIYENFEVRKFDVNAIRQVPGAEACFGLDFGYTTAPSAFIGAILLKDRREIYVFDEFYKKGMSNRALADMIKYKGYAKEVIVADSAEPKSIDEIKGYGISRIKPATKGKDSVMHGIQLLQDYKIIVNEVHCPNFDVELNNYCHKQAKDGSFLNEPIGEFNHGPDAIRYAVTDRLFSKVEMGSWDDVDEGDVVSLVDCNRLGY